VADPASVDNEAGRIVHYLEAPLKDVHPGSRVTGEIDADRRRDHMQQHSAQHVLSAAFVRLYNMPTVSFHMADDYCSIDLQISDLDTPSLTKEQIESAERLANEIMIENRDVEVRYVTRDEAASLGLRKLPPAERDQLRLIDIRDWDLSACGGTHVSHTGQIGGILLRKSEKVRQGYRVEFVAGQRAVATARRDFSTLSETAALFSAGIYDVPQQARKALDEIRLLRKQREQSQEELAAAQAATLTGGNPREQRPQADRPHFFRPRSQLPQAAGAKTHAAISRSNRAACDYLAAARAGFRSIVRPAPRHGSSTKRNSSQARRTRWRHQRPRPGRRAQVRRTRRSPRRRR
jgi:alanyl-tRNA synthetase